MRKIIMFLPLSILVMFSAVASAANIPIGIISLDPTGVASGATFDIQNLTGAGALPPDFPVVTSLNLSISSLTLDFTSGSPEILTAADFTSDGFGGFTGNNIFDLSSTSIVSASLMGTLSPAAIALSGGGSATLSGTFSALVLPSSGSTLNFFDQATITAPTAGVSATPEPGAYLLMALSVIFAIVLVSNRR